MPNESTEWWRSAVVYQIYPRSFADSDGDGDGVGDLDGIRSRLDHLAWLGVDAVWLSPIFPSPMADFGYDVADYCDIDPRFGTLDDFDALLAEAHARDIRVLLDWVPNHTSDAHPWFVQSRSSRTDPKRDWYVWRDPRPDGSPPNNWNAAFGGRAWTLDQATDQYYLHLFLPQQPDLNWRNPEVREAMHGTLRFWLDRGVDGFRVDVVHGLVKRADFADVDDRHVHTRTERYDEPAIHELIRGFRRLLDSYRGERMMIGEVYILSTAAVARYYGDGDELHLAFNFPPLYAPWEAAAWRHRIDRVVEELDPRRAWPTWVLSNHDNQRHRTRYGSEARARAAAVLLLTLRGTPFLYQGEELGLEDAVIPAEQVVDPGGRDGCRAPVPWSAGPDHGWPGGAWLPFPPGSEERNLDVLRADPGSILHLYRRLLAARRASPTLRIGDWSPVETPAGVLGYERSLDEDRRRVLVNFADQAVAVGSGDGWVVEVASDGAGEGSPFTGQLAPDQAVLLSRGD